MERRGAMLRSFEKPRAEAPPARLQVIGFNVSPMKAAADQAAAIRESLEMVSTAATAASYNELGAPSGLAKPAASSPRSALQQLLLHQSLPSTSTTSSNQCSPPLLPHPSSSESSQSAAKQTFTAGALLASHYSSPNQNLASGRLLQPATSSPSAANQKCTSGGLLPFAANQKWTSVVSRPESPSPAAYQGDSSSGLLKSLIQWKCATSDISTNQSSRTSFLSSFSQSQRASSSESSAAGTQILNQHNAKPAKVPIKESEAFLQIKHAGNLENGAKAHVAKSKKSNWLLHDVDEADDDDHPSAAEKCKKSNWKGHQPITEHTLGNEKSRKSSRSEEKCTKSSLFMFVASSPAPESHHHPHSEEHNAFENMDFLNSCHLCRRFLGLGQDVFMYSGDKAFCTMECRYQQIVIDERKERCPPPIIRSGASPVFHHSSASATATHHPIMINKPHFINTAAAA